MEAAAPLPTKREVVRRKQQPRSQIPSSCAEAKNFRRPYSNQPYSYFGGGMEAAAPLRTKWEVVRRKQEPRSQIPSPCAETKTLRRPLRPVLPFYDWSKKRARSNRIRIADRPCPDDNNNWRHWANLADGPAGPVHPFVDWSIKQARSSRIRKTDLPCPDDNNWRDWANLADGPAGLIAERVLAYDVADYVRFRAACRQWRQCSTKPSLHSAMDRRFHPWRWTMLRDELAVREQRCFLNTSTGECVKVDIPELIDNLLLAVTPEGLLVLVHETHRATVRLLNPLTRQLSELPPLTTMLPPKNHNMLSGCNSQFDIDFKAWGSGIANDNSTVVLCFSRLRMIGMAKPGDDRWTLLKYQCGTAATPLMFEGRLYCVSVDGLMVLETGSDSDRPPRLEVAAEMDMYVSSIGHSVHLVNNCGDLVLVHSHCSQLAARNKLVWCYDVYRVDLETRTLFPVKSLGGVGGRAVFMGMYCSLSLSLDIFPSGSISADTIYLSSGVSLEERAYHLADGSSEGGRRYKGSLLPRPHTLVDCLTLSVTL